VNRPGLVGASPPRRRRRHEEGAALLVTLLVVVLVVAAVLEIFRVGTRTLQTAAFARDSVRALLLAEAGAQAARIALRENFRDNDYDTLDEIWSRSAPPIELGEGTIEVAVEDEERKIDVNRLVLPNGNAPDEQRLAVFRRLLELLDLDTQIADAVVDWLDRDETPRTGGAESAYYERRPGAYRAKNDLFDTVEELRLVRGVTPAAFARLAPFVTVFSSGRVNVNTAPREVLMALSAGQDAAEAGVIDEAAANEIIEFRKNSPFQRIEDIEKVSPRLKDLFRRTRLRDLIDVRGTAWHVRSAGRVGDTVRIVDAVAARTGNDIQWRRWRVE